MPHTYAPASPFPADRLATLLDGLRAERPLTQCLTNTVVTNFTANSLLALGASPAMTDIVGEAGAFARIADGVLINLGTPHPEQRAAMLEAATACRDSGTPWVLDPVAVGSLPVRTGLARELLELQPTVIRGNPSEILALRGGEGGRGTDSTVEPADAVPAARSLVREHGVGAVAISGEVDLVVSTDQTWRIPHGHDLLTRVTGGGCAVGAVIAAFCAVTRDPVEAALAGSTTWEIAAEIGVELAADSVPGALGERTVGPGSFAVAVLDSLYRLTSADLRQRAAVTCVEVTRT